MISIYDSKFILIYCLILAFILGSVFGSFLNCVADRIKITRNGGLVEASVIVVDILYQY